MDFVMELYAEQYDAGRYFLPWESMSFPGGAMKNILSWQAMKVGRAHYEPIFSQFHPPFFFREMVVNQLLIFCHVNLDGIMSSFPKSFCLWNCFRKSNQALRFFFREMVVPAKINFGHAFSSKMCLLLKGTPFWMVVQKYFFPDIINDFKIQMNFPGKIINDFSVFHLLVLISGSIEFLCMRFLT